MHPHITLTVMDGKLEGKQYVFSRRRNCMIGRASDCEIRLPDDPEYLTVSRHHCLLELDAPEIRVRDLGSRNGTYVNGLRIGPALGRALAEDDEVPFTAFDLHHGDTLRVGDATFWVTTGEPIVAANLEDTPDGKKSFEAFIEPCLN
jgi:pSer/pThr/pTyr-binding forkhead associated (FHA) protein